MNYEVFKVVSGEESIDYIKKNNTDLMLPDMIMEPGIDGLDTYPGILEFQPEQKAIIVSGFSETERVKEAYSLGVGGYTISKSKRYFCWLRRRLPQRMYNTPRHLLLAAAISSLI